jgi:hypothetical protein
LIASKANGVRTVIVEDASRFARDLVTQELGILSLIGRGVRVVTASGDDLTNTDDVREAHLYPLAPEGARATAMQMGGSPHAKAAHRLGLENVRPLQKTE